MHVSQRMRSIALPIGGMALSLAAVSRHLPFDSGSRSDLSGVIDVLTVLNALGAALPPKVIHDP